MRIIDGIKKNARTAKWVGFLLIIAGIVALFSPLAAGVSVAMIVGVLLAFAGISQLVLAFRAGSFGEGLLAFLLGVLGVLAGLYMLARPGVALATLTLLLAAYFIIAGVLEVIAALGARPTDGWGMLMFGGVVTFILGVMIWSQFPMSGVWAIGVLVGIHMLIHGVTLMAIGGAAGRIAEAADEALGG